MVEGIGFFVFSFLLVALLIPVIIRFSFLLGLYDEANGDRKDHGRNVSRLGGLAIFAGFMAGVLLFTDLKTDLNMVLPLASFILVFTLGLNDDVCGTAPLLKIAVQLVSAIILVSAGWYQEPGWIGLLQIFLFVLLCNAFNLIDGLDGLAGTLGLFVNLFFGTLLFLGEDHSYGGIALMLSGSLAGFLLFNYAPAKIFMGDAMAMLMGLISGLMALRFIKLADGGGVSFLYSDSAMAIALAVLIVPVFDCLRVFLIRLLHRRSPFSGDRNHIHHRLKQMGYTDGAVVFRLLIFNICMVGMTLLLQHLGNFTLIILLFSICIFSNGLLTFMIRKTADKNYRLRDVLLRDTLNISRN
jgi:UDP-GlcNAc:undecaprenyl-phosphate GlcNAc-1-phosphate transferase